ncbi:MAG: hypothetical protein ACREMZ_08525 [Gemmatimonadales bacterium]
MALSLAPTAPAGAQHGTELGVQAVATGSDPALAVAGGYGAVRTSARTRLSAALSAGLSQGDFAARGEVLGHFLLSPYRRRGAGFYLAGGLAVVRGPVDRGYMVLSLGLEGQPAGRSGWAVEVGVGGGARLAVAYRWRWIRHPGIP